MEPREERRDADNHGKRGTERGRRPEDYEVWKIVGEKTVEMDGLLNKVPTITNKT